MKSPGVNFDSRESLFKKKINYPETDFKKGLQLHRQRDGIPVWNIKMEASVLIHKK